VALPAPVVHFGDWIKELYRAHGRAAIFPLNYDLLIERMLIDDDILGLQSAVTDFFSGLEERMPAIELVPGQPAVLGRLFYPEDPPNRPIHLHHLHGCLTHFRNLAEGVVIKVGAQTVRELDVYRSLAEVEEIACTPSVILGSKKVQKSREWPFAHALLSFEQELRQARTVVVAGYSFRDQAVNERLRAAAGKETRWIVISREPDASAAGSFCKTVAGVLGQAGVEFVLGGVGDDLPEAA
jgi:SIR2-like domain